MEKNSRVAWSVSDFEEKRMHLTDFLKSKVVPLIESHQCRRIVIRAPVKSGKREMVEYVAQRDNCSTPSRIHVFISAWHRVADKAQRDELSIHNMRVFSITNDTQVEECMKYIISKLLDGKDVVLHLDECDFGSGERQKLGKIYREFRANDSVTFILYSATPQEVLFSGEIDHATDIDYDNMINETIHAGEFIEYVPPPGYCGPGRFLDEGLVTEAMPFFYFINGAVHLSEQGSGIIADLRESMRSNPRRNLIVLRLSTSHSEGGGKRKENKAIYQFIKGAENCPELAGVSIFVSKDTYNQNVDRGNGYVQFQTFEWSNPHYWQRSISTEFPTILVIDQTASRSTELVCHDRIFAWHDFRNTVVFTTVSQAQERVNHYEQRYGGFQPIRIYGHKKTFELSAGRISYNDFMTTPWIKRKIDIRTVKQLKLKGDYYRVLSSSDNRVHPNYSGPLSDDEANKILQTLSSFAEVKVSARVRGRSGLKPIFSREFVPLSPEEFSLKKNFLESKIPGGATFRNPFNESIKKGKDGSKFKGHIRGVWKVWSFEELSEKEKAWGGSARMTICYNGDVLGVDLRWNTGMFEEINTLETFKSMYKR